MCQTGKFVLQNGDICWEILSHIVAFIRASISTVHFTNFSALMVCGLRMLRIYFHMRKGLKHNQNITLHMLHKTLVNSLTMKKDFCVSNSKITQNWDMFDL